MTQRIGSTADEALSERIEFRLIYGACFTVFLAGALLSRFDPRAWRTPADAPRGRRSVLGEAKVAADTYAPFAFMG